MSNSKISALTSATTPLAGTETLPIVQSSTTKQVSVANLTAGRAVNVSTLTATGTISTTGTSSYFRGLAGASVFLQNSNATANWQFFPNGTTTSLYLNSAQNGSFVIQNPVNIQADTTLTSANLVQGTAAKGINFTANTPASGMTSQLLNWYEEGTWTPADNSGAVSITVNSATYVRIGRFVTLQMDITYPTTASGATANLKNPPFTPANISGGGLYCNSTSGITGLQITNSSLIYFQTTAGNNATNVQLTGSTIRTSFSYQV